MLGIHNTIGCNLILVKFKIKHNVTVLLRFSSNRKYETWS